MGFRQARKRPTLGGFTGDRAYSPQSSGSLRQGHGPIEALAFLKLARYLASLRNPADRIDLAEVKEIVATVRREAAAVGRDPSGLRCVLLALGDPNHAVGLAADLAVAGIDELVINAPLDDVDERRMLLAQLRKEVPAGG